MGAVSASAREPERNGGTGAAVCEGGRDGSENGKAYGGISCPACWHVDKRCKARSASNAADRIRKVRLGGLPDDGSRRPERLAHYGSRKKLCAAVFAAGI